MDFESNVSMNFRLTTLVVIVANSIISYLFERIIVWQISICCKNREDRKILREQQRQIEEQQQALAIEDEDYPSQPASKVKDLQDISPPSGEPTRKKKVDQEKPRKSAKDPKVKQKFEDHGGVRQGHEETKEENQRNNNEHQLIMRQGGEQKHSRER